jgi:PTS system nitrogen regulatory IIA component
MHFGSVLRLLRVSAGVNLRDLARTIGVSPAYLSRVEHGYDSAPTHERLATIANALHLVPEVLTDLAQRLDPSVTAYLEATPAVLALLREMAEHKLGTLEVGRVRAFVQNEFQRKGASEDARATRLGPLLAPERIVTGLACSDLEDAIDLAALRLAASPEAGGTDAATLAEHIREREALAPTLLGGGVAVPHTRARVGRSLAALVTLARPLSLDTPDRAPVRVVVVLITPSRGREHLMVLAQVARLTRDDLAGRLEGITDPRRVYATLLSLEAGACLDSPRGR